MESENYPMNQTMFLPIDECWSLKRVCPACIHSNTTGLRITAEQIFEVWLSKKARHAAELIDIRCLGRLY